MAMPSGLFGGCFALSASSHSLKRVRIGPARSLRNYERFLRYGRGFQRREEVAAHVREAWICSRVAGGAVFTGGSFERSLRFP